MTKSYRQSEETINTHLALLLTKYGVSAESETIHRLQKPDVMFNLGGLRVIMEGKCSDVPNAEKIVLDDAFHRIETGICHIAVAVVYPENLRTISSSEIGNILPATPLKFRVLSETGESEWSEAVPSEILATLRRTHDALIKDDIVADSAKKISQIIDGISKLWANQSQICDNLSVILGMPSKRGEEADERLARRMTATKVAALVLINGMIFQEQLSATGGDKRIKSLRYFDKASDPIEALKNHWYEIWTKINYVPIFQIGYEILNEMPITPTAISTIKWLIDETKKICANQSAFRHDLMGRIYHWLLHYAKYLGTYYTATSSATLLLKLVFSQKWSSVDFGSPKKLAEFVVADLACGTGTLLMASAQAITDQFIIRRYQSKRSLTENDLRNLHEALMENVLYGYDVLTSAVHLTASTLGMLAPNVTYRKMNLFVMPMGAKRTTVTLGSLEFINKHRVITQLALDDSHMEVKQTGVASEHYSSAEIPSIDLCVMNPPFVRSVGGNLLFGSLPEEDRSKLQSELKKRAKSLSASVTAGLGSVFLAMADKHLRPDGRLAFILPIALATGEAWGISRKLLSEKYHLEMVITSHDAGRPNFSENTDLSEIMIIARKLKVNEVAGNTTYINLWHNPTTIYEAMDVAERIINCNPLLPTDRNISSVVGINGRKLAEIITLPPSQGEEQWIGVQFAQTATLRAAVSLSHGQISIPGKKFAEIPLCKLQELGELGPDRKRIHEGFKISYVDWSPHPSFWNHDAQAVTTIAQKPNSHLLPWVDSPRGEDYGERRLWPRSGRILLAERLWPITHKVMAVGFAENVLGNTWWALKTNLAINQEKALLLWLNSTPALLLFLSKRVSTRSAWMQVKQPAWENMPVLNIRNLPDEKISSLAKSYDELAEKKLLALAKLDKDPVRSEIDGALSAALGLPEMKSLRDLLSHEPGLTGKEIGPKPTQRKMFDDESEESESIQLKLIY